MNAPSGIRTAVAERMRVRVCGRVQGVGFRPFVHGLASHYGLAGWVRNDAEGVLIEVEGPDCDAFVDDLLRKRPTPARIERIETCPLSPEGASAFSILESARGPVCRTMIGPDVAVCRTCLEELFDPDDRRYRYPFLNCAQCGPRYTITRGLPYDRPLTSMAGFAMCEACAREHRDPADRRFHAQPNACPVCGPKLSMAIEEIVRRLNEGEIVALKGLGGFHLACDAAQPEAVERLRARKQRDARPFAVMVASVNAARRFAHVDDTAAQLLEDPARPIVLVPKLPGALADEVAPDIGTLGLMLPYTPLHYLLFHEAAGRPAGTAWLDRDPPPLALVMTSANPGGEPLVIDDQEAKVRLAGIAGAVVTHDRPIVVRADDSVLQPDRRGSILVRRSRGFVPSPIRLPRTLPPVLALGGHLKATVCVTRGDEAFLSQHIGDLDSAPTRRFLQETITHLLDILDVTPDVVAHDLHPDFFTTRLAGRWPCRRVGVQHHHAHIASVLAEHGCTDPALGLALDGLGYGPDGTIWGGELLSVQGARYERVGHLRQLALPGGDAVVLEPWRMAAAALHALGRSDEIAPRFARFGPAGAVAQLLQNDWPMPRTSSLGRWFDAAAALSGVLRVARYEGHAAMALEARVRTPRMLENGWRVAECGSLDLLPLLGEIADLPSAEGADLWHGTLAAALTDWALLGAERLGVQALVLGGGCLLNRVLRELLVARLSGRLDLLLPMAAPPNDGGLSLGQAWVAAHAIEGS